MNRLKNSITFFIESWIVRCPKTGKMVGIQCDSPRNRLFFPIIGLIALVWFLVRVVPKPSRITYPCQRFAVGIGSSFLAYGTILLTSCSLLRFIRRNRSLSMTIGLILVCTAFGVLATAITGSLYADSAVAVLSPPEGVNHPMGKARGIYPGRVVWIQDMDATRWDGEKGTWWDDTNTDQARVDAMFSQALRNLTGASSDAEAWNALFHHHNKMNGKGDRGYQPNETIAIKLNTNPDVKPGMAWNKKGYASPQMVNTLVQQLVENAGVPGANITLTDPSRCIGDPIYTKIRSNSKSDYQQIVFAENTDRHASQYVYAEPDTACPIHFILPDGQKQIYYFPKTFTQSTYMINAAQFRPHSIFGITMVGKNHFGSLFDGKGYQPASLHAFAVSGNNRPNRYGDPHCHPSLLGHKVTNSKTFLYMLDGLYTSHTQTEDVIHWSSLNNDWFSSLLMSQDPIALDSVGYDLVRSEPACIQDNPCFNGPVDNFLHEAALADKPSSGFVYDPEQDGSPLPSLGVHEHWNNDRDKKYSRNLGADRGIELISITNRETK